MAKIGLPKGSGKLLKVREKSVKSKGILKWILSGNPEVANLCNEVGWFKHDLVEYSEDRFSGDEAHMSLEAL